MLSPLLRMSQNQQESKRGALPRTLDVHDVTSVASGNTPTVSVTELLQSVNFHDIKKESTVNGPWSTGHDVTATMPFYDYFSRTYEKCQRYSLNNKRYCKRRSTQIRWEKGRYNTVKNLF